ncbi:hypothetical protein L6R49_02065, partial [Myxococcota bacterium]|nr:hypothetical protein [Myxococcota bacterium]
PPAEPSAPPPPKAAATMPPDDAPDTSVTGQAARRMLTAALVVIFIAFGGAAIARWEGVGPFGTATDAPEGAAAARRPLELVVTGLAAGTPFTARLDGQAPEAQDGFRLRFAAAPLGEHSLDLTVGAGCEVPAGEPVPVWCGHQVEAVTLEAGDSPQLHTVSLLPPAPRPVRLSLPDLKASVRLRWAEEPPAPIKGGQHLLEDVLPGAYELELIAGECPETSRGCEAKGECPPGCVSWVGEVVVPLGEGEHPLTLSLREPTPLAGANDGAAAAPKSRRQVSQGDFARWLKSHPEWQREAAQQAEKADKKYLKGWTEDGTPPSPGAALVNVSWYAAQAYCAGRGGLAALDAEPLTWEEGGGLAWHEHRQSGGAPAWRRSDGSTSTNVTPNESGQFIGVRCVR